MFVDNFDDDVMLLVPVDIVCTFEDDGCDIFKESLVSTQQLVIKEAVGDQRDNTLNIGTPTMAFNTVQLVYLADNIMQFVP